MFSRVLGELLRLAQSGNHTMLWFGMNHASARYCGLAWEMLLAYKNKSIKAIDNITEPSRFISVTAADALRMRLCGRNHESLFEEKNFSHARKSSVRIHRENLTHHHISI